MNLDNLRAIQEKNQAEALKKREQAETMASFLQIQETIVKSFATLVGYLDNKVTKTEVVNQLKEIGTPDALKVVQAVNNLDQTIKSKENVDLTEVTELLKAVLAEAKELPKKLPETPEQKFVDYSETLNELAKAVKSVEEAVKSQETHVEAPVVNVPETVVNVPETDLKPLEKRLEKVDKSIKEIKIPEPIPTDTKPLEKLIREANKHLLEIIDKPTGGGGGTSFPAINAQGVVQPLNLDADGALLVTTPTYDIRNIEEDVTYKYFGFEERGGTSWRIMRKTLATSAYLYATGTTDYATAWTNKATEVYA
jgi:hypothetical protein